MFHNSLILISDRDFPSGHGPAGHFVGFVEFEAFIVFEAAPGEVFHVVWRETFPENVGSNPHYRSGVELGIDGGFGMVAHNQAGELEAGILKRLGTVVPELHVAIIVFHVGRIGVRTEIAPFPYYGIPDKAVVPFIGIPEDDNVVHLAAHFGMRAYGSGTIYFRA